jgi:hypothetical protein
VNEPYTLDPTVLHHAPDGVADAIEHVHEGRCITDEDVRD